MGKILMSQYPDGVIVRGDKKTLKCRKIQTQEITPYLREKKVSKRCFAEKLDLRAPQNNIPRYQA